MNTHSKNQRWTALVLVALLMLLASLACQFGGQVSKVVRPDKTAAPAPAQPGSTRVAGEKNPGGAPAGDGLALNNPAVGLAGLKSYHQKLSVTVQGKVKGQPYDSTETVERSVAGADSASVVQTSTGGAGMYLYSARVNGALYTQQKEGQPCRAAEGDAAAGKNAKDPAGELPKVSGVWPGPGAEPDSTHYQIQLRKNQQGEGTFDLANAGGYVLRYHLVLNQTSGEGDFQGQMTWDYTLSQVNEVPALTLPAACQPVLSDFPVLPGAENVLRKPGMVRYTAAASAKQAREFYLSELSQLGWQALPGTAPAPAGAEESTPPNGPQVLTFARAQADGSGQVAVIQVSGENNALQIIAQVASTKKPALASSQAEALPTPAGGEDQTPEPTSGAESGEQAALPKDLPIYPGAKVMMQNEQVLMLQTTDSLEKVAAYYKTALTQAGWEKSQEAGGGDTTFQMWAKDSFSIVLTITAQGGQTQVIFATGK